MKRYLLLSLLMFGAASVALAQDATDDMDSMDMPMVAAAAPAANNNSAPAAFALPDMPPAVPVAQVPQAQMQPQPGVVPPLPPSNNCNQGDIVGVWKLYQIYENPPSIETAAFSSNPSQYVSFAANSTYKEHKTPYAENKRKVLNTFRQQSPPSLQQYLMHESGALYFYRDGAAIDTQMCFIVAGPRGDFAIGQMILMPPQGQSSVRLIKVYEKIWAPRQRQQKPRANQRRRN